MSQDKRTLRYAVEGFASTVGRATRPVTELSVSDGLQFRESGRRRRNFPHLAKVLATGPPSRNNIYQLTKFNHQLFLRSTETEGPIGSSDHMLVKVDISLAVIREPPQCRRVWNFTQADWKGLQAAIKLRDWSPITTLSNITSSWEFFQRNLLSLMHRFIPSRLQLSYPSPPPTVH